MVNFEAKKVYLKESSNDLNDVVIRVELIATGSNEKTHDFTVTLNEPDLNNFTPFDDVTKEIARDWAVAKLTENDLQYFEQLLNSDDPEPSEATEISPIKEFVFEETTQQQ